MTERSIMDVERARYRSKLPDPRSRSSHRTPRRTRTGRDASAHPHNQALLRALEPGAIGHVQPRRSVRVKSWQNERRAGNCAGELALGLPTRVGEKLWVS